MNISEVNLSFKDCARQFFPCDTKINPLECTTMAHWSVLIRFPFKPGWYVCLDVMEVISVYFWKKITFTLKGCITHFFSRVTPKKQTRGCRVCLDLHEVIIILIIFNHSRPKWLQKSFFFILYDTKIKHLE